MNIGASRHQQLVIETIQLGPTGRTTTRLGFGCAHLAGAMGRRESLAILECAYDAGIRHFDVARMYGSGDAERCVGKFARRHRDDITITTKLGISPGPKNRLRHAARTALRPIFRLAPRLKPSRTTVENLSPPAKVRTSFTVEDAEQSLHASLAALKTEHVDLLLLHEATAADLNDDRLLQFLENALTSGKIGAFGVGSDRNNIDGLLTHRPQYCKIVQYQWSVFDKPPRHAHSFRIHHGAFAKSLQPVRAGLENDPDRRRRWSAAVGLDLSQNETFAKLAFKASLVLNPNSIILFASTQPRHVMDNCITANDSKLDAPCRRFFEMIHKDICAAGALERKS